MRDDFGYPILNYYYVKFVNRPMNVFSGIEFSSIDMVSDMDFDEEHPAGTSLADIAMLSTYWGRPELDRYYRPDKGSSANCSYYPESAQAGIRLFRSPDALTPDNLSLIGMQGINSSDTYYEVVYKQQFYIGAITFSQMPTCGLKHTFTVTMTTVDGRKFESQVYAYWHCN